MRIALRCIYYKAVTPSCDIIDMDDVTWKKLHIGGHKREEIALKLLEKERLMRSCEGAFGDFLGRTR